jgi:hypothetical protein
MIMSTVTESANTVQTHHTLFADAVTQVSALAQVKLPESLHGRVQRATALVLNGAVWMEEDGCTTQVLSHKGQTWYAVNGHCVCPDAPRAESGLCKHRLARAIYRRAGEVMLEPPPQVSTTIADASATPQGIPAQHIVMIQGKPFVKFAGLLQMAHERGLVALTAQWTYNDAELSLAHAVATFQDGRRFEESGDASPANVTKKIAGHFRRVALTRAKARVLRDALGVDLVAVEELADE